LTYAASRDFGVAVAYFAPRPSSARRARFDRFIAPLRSSGASVRIAELVLDGRDPELPDSTDVVRVRAHDALWQKERLLSVAIATLPAEISKVAWLDADILFDDAEWMPKSSRALDDVPVLQPFSRMIHLDRDGRDTPPIESYASVFARDPRARTTGRFDAHGHTGHAWAARRDVLTRHGLFDACIAGGADHVMAHAFTGDHDVACLDRVLDRGPQRAHYVRWAEGITQDTGRLGVIDGTLRHLWHGELSSRRYVERYETLRALGFDPARDLVLEGHTWSLAPSADPRLRAFLDDYFASRTDD
jgi:hypothetical protein